MTTDPLPSRVGLVGGGARSARRWPQRFVRLGLTGAALLAFEAALLIGLAYGAAANYVQPGRTGVWATPANYGLPYEAIELQTDDGLTLKGWYVPSRNGAALVLVHGIGTNRADLLPLARDLWSQGFGILLFDLRAHGESEGAVSTLGVQEVQDVRSALQYLQARPEVEPDRVGVYGASLGAAVAIMAAAELPELKAVVADSAFASVDWLVRHEFAALVRLPAFVAPLVVTLGSWQAGVDPAQIAPVERIGRIAPRPVLLVHGERDATFSIRNLELLAEAAGEPKEVWVASGARHSGAYREDPGRYVERVGRFFQTALRS